MWGLPQLGRWKWHDPDVHIQLLADNNTRLWVFSPQTLGCSDPAAMIGYCDQAQGSNRAFYQHYRTVGGHNGHFDFPAGGQHDWWTWGPQLAAMSSELVPPSSESVAPVPWRGAAHGSAVAEVVHQRRRSGVAGRPGRRLLSGCTSGDGMLPTMSVPPPPRCSPAPNRRAAPRPQGRPAEHVDGDPPAAGISGRVEGRGCGRRPICSH